MVRAVNWKAINTSNDIFTPRSISKRKLAFAWGENWRKTHDVVDDEELFGTEG